MNFEVSVVIPVFNAERYVEKAILSALDLPQVKEVIVINDGSTDNSPAILKKLEAQYENLLLLNHPNGGNRGRAASRNLGIKNSSSRFIAFLDADDYYLKNRFSNDEKLFLKEETMDGVYNAIGVEFYRESTEKEREELSLTTLRFPVSPKLLFHEMTPKGTAGRFHGNGLTVKKEIFEKVGYFNEALEVAEDTELWIKMALEIDLYPGVLDKPVAIRGVHGDNVFSSNTRTKLYSRNYLIMASSLLDWAYKTGKDTEILLYFLKRKISDHVEIKEINQKFLYGTIFWIKNALKYPKLFRTREVIKLFPPIEKLQKLRR